MGMGKKITAAAEAATITRTPAAKWIHRSSGQAARNAAAAAMGRSRRGTRSRTLTIRRTNRSAPAMLREAKVDVAALPQAGRSGHRYRLACPAQDAWNSANAVR